MKSGSIAATRKAVAVALLRDIAEGRVFGDTTILLDPTVVAQINTQYDRAQR